MWNKKKAKINNEKMEKIVEILVNCHHLVKVSVNKFVNKKIDYRFLDMTTGYYWQISLRDNTITIKSGDIILIPHNSEELYKMLDIEINKSAVYETQKQSILLKKD